MPLWWCLELMPPPLFTVASTVSMLTRFRLIQIVAVKLSWFGKIWEMYSVRLLPTYKPVGRGDEALIVAARLFALIPLHRLKRTDSVNVPMSSNDLAIGSANSGANNYFRRCGA